MPTEEQDDLDDLAPEEVVMRDADQLTDSEGPSERKGVLLDDHHYFSDDNTHIPAMPKKLPRGTSRYQAAWYLDNVSDSESDLDDAIDQDGDFSMRPPMLPQDGAEGLIPAQAEPTETAPSEALQSEMFLDPAPDEEAEQLAAFRSRTENEGKDDLEFPDEIELHPNVLARERLARYRGLKSLRPSAWETEEDQAYEPSEWRRLLHVADYKSSRNHAAREALIGGVQVRRLARLRIKAELLSPVPVSKCIFAACQPHFKTRRSLWPCSHCFAMSTSGPWSTSVSRSTQTIRVRSNPKKSWSCNADHDD